MKSSLTMTRRVFQGVQYRLLCILVLLLTAASGAGPSVRLELSQTEAWTGQRIPFFIELQAPGSFTGAAAFEIAEIPKTVVLKVGNPTLGSTTIDDVEFFTQRHEFALFSQADGTVRVPPIAVRFSHRNGYTGPSFDVELMTKSAELGIRRPDGVPASEFLVTTELLTVEESWSSEPDTVEVGAVIKRHISQRATELTGIALAPPPAGGPAGVRLYTAEPEVKDITERGQFRGERRDTLTYLVQQPGVHTLPALQYVSWNPVDEKLQAVTLPERMLTALAPPSAPVAEAGRMRWAYLGLLPVLAGVWIFRKAIGRGLTRFHGWIDPLPKRKARALLKACRRGDPQSAYATFLEWRKLCPFEPIEDYLRDALSELKTELFSRQTTGKDWTGEALARAFRHRPQPPKRAESESLLPPLNL